MPRAYGQLGWKVDTPLGRKPGGPGPGEDFCANTTKPPPALSSSDSSSPAWAPSVHSISVLGPRKLAGGGFAATAPSRASLHRAHNPEALPYTCMSTFSHQSLVQLQGRGQRRPGP